MAQQGPARRSLATRVPAVIGLPDLVLTRHDKVAKAAKRAKRSGVVTDFHALRIRCKRLRYALEFSSDVYGGRTSRFVRELTALQDELGAMQDAEVASLQLAALATGDAHLPAATIFVMGGVAEQHRREVNRFLKRLPDELPRTRGQAWRELRELMERRKAEAEAARPPVRTTLRALPRPQPDAEPAPAGTGRRHRPPDRCTRRGPGTDRPGATTAAAAAGAHGPGSRRPASQARGNEPASSPMTTRGCSVTMKCSLSVSRKLPMSVQMSGKSGSAMWAR